VSEEIETSAAAYLPFDPDLGDHRPVVVNISKRSLLGVEGPKIKPSAARRLNSKVKRIRQKYIDRLEEQFRKHKVLKRLAKLETEAEEEKLSEEARQALENLDRQITELMTCAESKCRKKYKNDYDFSPEVRQWIERGRAIRAIIRMKLGRECNIGNLKRTAKRCGLTNPLSYTRSQLWEMYYKCKAKCKKLLADSPWMRKQFLSQRLQTAIDEGKQQEANEIKSIIRGENQRRIWRGINQGLGKSARQRRRWSRQSTRPERSTNTALKRASKGRSTRSWTLDSTEQAALPYATDRSSNYLVTTRTRRPECRSWKELSCRRKERNRQP